MAEWVFAVNAVCKRYKLPHDVRRLVVATFVAVAGESCYNCAFYCGDWCAPCSYLAAWRKPVCMYKTWEESQYNCMQQLRISREWRTKRIKFY